MRAVRTLFPAVLLGGVLAAWPAAAYVGPGAGLGVVTALWGLVVAVVMALGFIVLWPVRRYLLRRRQLRAAGPQVAEPELGAASRSGRS